MKRKAGDKPLPASRTSTTSRWIESDELFLETRYFFYFSTTSKTPSNFAVPWRFAECQANQINFALEFHFVSSRFLGNFCPFSCASADYLYHTRLNQPFSPSRRWWWCNKVTFRFRGFPFYYQSVSPSVMWSIWHTTTEIFLYLLTSSTHRRLLSLLRFKHYCFNFGWKTGQTSWQIVRRLIISQQYQVSGEMFLMSLSRRTTSLFVQA